MSHTLRFVLPTLVGVVAFARMSPQFEVASIRPNRSGDKMMRYNPARGGKFTATNCSLALLMHYAFDIDPYQIVGAPDWVKSDRYDISAEADADVPVLAIQAMLQRLIEDRFQLTHHWETRDEGGYYLVVSKPGRLHESAPGNCPSILSSPDERTTAPGDAPCGSLRNSPGDAKGYKLTSAEIADSLAWFLGRPVLDKTGLTGRYDVELRWTLQPDRTDADLPSLFSALQEQVGLRLESGKAAVKVLVVDTVLRSSAN